MKVIRALLPLLCLASPLAFASEDAPTPKIDPKKIINDSNNFLKEREPEMTSEEYALYEKVSALLNTQPEFAVKLLEGMLNEKEKPSPAFEFILGNAYFYSNDINKAIESYKSAVTRYPSFLRAWSNLGVLYYTNQRFAEAVPCLSKSVSLGDREPKTFGLLAYSLERAGNIVGAEVAYMQALAGEPANTDWMEGLLRIYVAGKQYARAEWLVKSLIRAQPTEARFWLAYANILAADNRKLEAIAMLETTRGTAIAGVEELSMLADLYADQKLYPEAISTYGYLAERNRSLGEARMLNLARMLIANRGFTEAASALAKIQGALSKESQTNFLQTRADLHIAQEKWKEAQSDVEQILATSPMNGKALLSHGRCLNEQHDSVKAYLSFERASQIPDSCYLASIELANLELKNRHYDKAVEHLEKALTIENTSMVREYLARIRTLVTPKS